MNEKKNHYYERKNYSFKSSEIVKNTRESVAWKINDTIGKTRNSLEKLGRSISNARVPKINFKAYDRITDINRVNEAFKNTPTGGFLSGVDKELKQREIDSRYFDLEETGLG